MTRGKIRVPSSRTLLGQCKALGLPGLFLLLSLATSVAVAGAAGHRTLRVGVYQNPPKIFLSQGRISGIFGNLIYDIAQHEGWTIVPAPCTWQQCLSMVQSGQIDLMPDVALNSQRDEVMSFNSVPALYSWSELYRNRSAHLLTIRDLANKRIAVLADSVQQRYLKDMINKFGIRNVQLVPASTLEGAFELTAKGKADAVAANYFFGDAAVQKYDLRSTPVIFQPAQLFFATPKGRDAAVRHTIDTYLSNWEQDPDSAYYRILNRWEVAGQKSRIPAAVWWTVGVLAVLLAIAIFVTLVLRRMMLKKAHDLAISEVKHALIMDNVEAYIYIKGLDLRYQYFNKKGADFFNRPASAVIGLTDEELFDLETARHIHETDDRVLRTGLPITIEGEYRSKDGRTQRTFVTVKQPLRDEDNQIYALCGISTDFTEHKRYEERIEQLAFHDPLTGLANRTLLLDRARHALDGYARTGSNGALLFIDLDNFKALNDTLGHAMGDLLLQQGAERLKRHARQSDTLARLGGDEFVLLMEQLGQDNETLIRDIEAVANKLLLAFTAEPFVLEKTACNVTGSIGVALFSDTEEAENEKRVDMLLKQADLAMYDAKAEGRNQVKFFNPRMQDALEERVELEAHLHDALRLGQFVLVYQPIVSSNGELIGAEALARWPHPDKGLISPSVFIPCAESTGQIIELGDWIMRTACRQLAAWREDPVYRKLMLSVNVSARQFHHPEFVARVIKAIDEAGADPRRLELELTESLLSHDIENLIEKMKALKAIGIRFSLDDFGTGYSSLSYLKRLPLDHLKIDQSFVRDVLDDPNDAAIVRTILALGKSLDLGVVAEGVETAAQRDALLLLGCQSLQGYLFGYPGPPESLVAARLLVAN